MNQLYCQKCRKPVNQIIDDRPICDSCLEKEYIESLRAKETGIQEAKDFKTWRLEDVSELFWIHLGLYQKNPNTKSLGIMRAAYNWAVHESKGLANSFHHALKWAGIENIYKEYRKLQRKGE